jgi:hypothetical protein
MSHATPNPPDDGLSEEHRRMIAEGLATMSRFPVEPCLKHGRPKYIGTTVTAAAHVKAKRARQKGQA